MAAARLSDPFDVLSAPLPELMAEAARIRDARPRRPGHVLPQGLHPADDAVPRPLRLLHVRQAAGPPRLPYLELDEVLAIARAGRAAGCWEALFTLGEEPEERYPAAREWLAARGYGSTVDYLVAAAGAVLAETGLLPHANAGALSGSRTRAPAGRVAVAGDDARVPGRPPGRAGRAAPPGPGQDARAAPGHPGGGRRGPHPVHHRPPRRLRRDPGGAGRDPAGHRRGAPPPRPRAGGHRPELPPQAGDGHGRTSRPARKRRCSGRRRWPGCCSTRPSTSRRRPTWPPTWARSWPPASTTGVASRPSPPTTSTRSGPGRSSTGCGWPPRRRARSSPPASPSTPSTCADPRSGSTPTSASRCCAPPTARAWPGRAPGRPAATSCRPILEPGRGRRGRVGRSARCCRRGAGPAGRRRRDRHAARRPGAGAGRRLRAGRRPAPPGGGRRRHLRPEPQHQLHQRLHVQVPLLRLLQGAAVAQPPGRPLPPRLRGDPAPGGRGGGVRRHRGLPAGRHPPELRRRLLPRGHPGGEGRRPGHPRARLHRPRGPRGRPPARDGPGRIPGPPQGRRAGHPARHGGRDPRRRGPGGHLPRQGHHRRMARGPPGRPLDRPAVQRHDHVRPRRTAGARRPPPRPGPGPAGRDGRVHRGGAPALRAHGRARSSCRRSPAPGPTFRETLLHPRRVPHRHGRLHRQHPVLLGEDGPRRAPARPSGPAATTWAAR